MPKSMTLTWPLRVSMTLAGLMSRWTIPARWEYSRAWRMPMVISMDRSGSSLRPECSSSRSVDPSTYSITMYGMDNALDVVLTRVVHGDDRGMVERGGRLGLPAEPGLERRIACEVGSQRLHRHGAAEPGVMGEMYLRHATTAEHLAELRTGRRGDAALP